MQCLSYGSDESSVNSVLYDSETEPNITIVSAGDSEAIGEYGHLKHFIIDTIDQKNITIDEGDIMEKIMNYGILEYEQTLQVLNQAKSIYQNALVNHQTLEQAKEQVEIALKSFSIE